MARDTANARPRSISTHDLNCMGRIVLPIGQSFQVPIGKFTNTVYINDHPRVNTIDEIRRMRLEMLISRYNGKLANLNEALGLERNHSQLARIRNRNARTDRPGKYFDMGDEQAREIEEKLSLDRGWMDTPPTYSDLHGENDPRSALIKATEDMSAADLYTALRLVTALKSPSSDSNSDRLARNILQDPAERVGFVERTTFIERRKSPLTRGKDRKVKPNTADSAVDVYTLIDEARAKQMPSRVRSLKPGSIAAEEAMKAAKGSTGH